MDPFTAFFIFAALLSLDLLASHAWLPAYFRFGLPVFFLRGSSTNLQKASLPTAQVAHALEMRFKSRPAHPTIRFKALSPDGIALREALFEDRAGFKYLPVMHSFIRLRPDQGRLSITGYINAYALFVTGYLVYRSLVETAFIPIAILVLVILALSYFAQSGINQQVATEITKEPEI